MKKVLIIILLLIILSPFPIAAFLNKDSKTIYELKPEVGNFIKIDNTDVYYELTGEKNGPYIVLIHGFGGNSSSWRKNVSTLHELGYQTLAIDLPPFGFSQKSRYANINQDNQAELVYTLLQKLNIKKASFVGHSYGGGVILYLANSHPEVVDKLIIVDGAINNKGENKIRLLSNIIKLPIISDYAKSLITILINPDRALNILQSTYYDKTKITQADIEKYLVYSRTNDWQEGYLAMLTTPYTSSDINYENINKNIGEDVILIWGREDNIVPLSKGEELYQKLPSSTLNIIDKSGHLPMEEQNDLFNNVLRKSVLNNY